MKFKWDIILLTTGLLLSIGWQAYDHFEKEKMAYVNLSKVFDSFALKKELADKYTKVTAARQADLDSIRAVLQLNGADSKTSPLLQEYYRRERQYSELNQSLTEEYDKQILVQMNTYMKEFSEKGGYTLVFGANGNGSLIHADEKLDITDEMITYINNRYQGL